MLIFWIIVFVISLFLLVKGADWLINSSEKIGLSLGISPFIIGVTIVGVGTSFPELISSFAAVLKGVPEVVTSNAIGSNIANILLIVGVCALMSRKIIIRKSLIDLDLPLLAISTVIFLGVVLDKQVTVGESILMLGNYAIYVLYTITHKEDEDIFYEEEVKEENPKLSKTKTSLKDFVMLVIGIICLVLGATYLIDALVKLSNILNIATDVISITAVAVGTSLPELLVSVKAALQKKSDLALGNIFGSNIFNILAVVGIPGLLGRLPVDDQTFKIGIPALAMATLLFIISGISKRIHIWEGAFYLSLYVLFVAKLFNWF